MRNTSSKYKDQIKGIREFCAKIIINYSDGSEETLTDLQDFKQLKFVDECSGSSEFEIGAAVIGEALITLNNRTGKFDGKNFYGAHISAYAGIMVDSKPELLEMGHYIVDEPVSPGISIALTAYDNMILLDKAYKPGITYPATLAQIAEDACSQCGVILESSTFPRSAYIVEKAPEEGTCREIMAAVAQLAGSFVKARSNGKIAIAWYADTAEKTIDTLYSKTICTDDVTITGIMVTVGETTAESGADGYRLSISDNILMDAGKVQETADYLGNRLIGLSFRPLSVSCQADPSIEAGDRITVKDEKGNEYQTVITSTTFAVLEAQKIACNAASPTVNAGQRLSETSKAIIASRKYADEAVEHERTERETALVELNRQLAESSGMHVTAQKQNDGSTIYYAHDKPLLSESKIVWKFTAEALGISTDGGKTYPYGLDVSGTAILDRIFAIGIDVGNGKFVVDSSGTMQATGATIDGNITSSSGKIAGFTLNSNGFTSDVSDRAYYNDADLAIVQNMILGYIPTTDDALKYYDLNGDGRLTSADNLLIQRILNGTDQAPSVTGSVRINPNSFRETIMLTGTSDNISKRSTRIGIGCVESNVGSFGNMYSKSVSADNMSVSGNIKINGDGKVDGVSEYANKIKDSGDGRDITLAYSKDGLTTALWFAAWNNGELRAISPWNLRNAIYAAQKIEIGHTEYHGYIRFTDTKIQIAWETTGWTGAINNSWGSGYESTAINLNNWMKPFSMTPRTFVSAYCVSGESIDVGVNRYAFASKTSGGSVYLQRNTALAASKPYHIISLGIGPYE